MTFVVDADILGILQRAECLAVIQALGQLPWVITEEVWYEVTERAAAHGAYPATVDEMRKFLVAVVGAPTAIAPMSQEAESLSRLLAPPAKEDPGELSVIALCVSPPGGDRSAPRSCGGLPRRRGASWSGDLDPWLAGSPA